MSDLSGREAGDKPKPRREPKYHRRPTYMNLLQARIELGNIEREVQRLEAERDAQKAAVREIELDAREWMERDNVHYAAIVLPTPADGVGGRGDAVLIVERREYSIDTRIVKETK